MRRIKNNLIQWNKESFGNVDKVIEKIENKLGLIDRDPEDENLKGAPKV